jgi:hypothetical protein
MTLPGFHAQAAIGAHSRTYLTLSGSGWRPSGNASEAHFLAAVTPSACYGGCFDNPKTCTKDCWSTCGPSKSTPLCLPGQACCPSPTGTTYECCPVGGACNNGTCSCPVGLTNCAGSCVNLNTSQNDCGVCGRTCVGGTCSGGICGCPNGLTLSNGVCCASGLVGSNGICCPTGQTNSNGVCCSPGLIGSNGNCCPNGQTNCGAAARPDCVNTNSDTNNCGGCGITCSPGQTCSGGVCSGSSCPKDQNAFNACCFGLYSACTAACAVAGGGLGFLACEAACAGSLAACEACTVWPCNQL